MIIITIEQQYTFMHAVLTKKSYTVIDYKTQNHKFTSENQFIFVFVCVRR